MTAYRVLVTGSRAWADLDRVVWELNRAVDRAMAAGHDRMVVVHGACPRGADAMASAWVGECQQYDRIAVDEERHPADWKRYGRRAGILRNHAMINSGVDECLAFIRDSSPGATHCAGAAERADVPVRRWVA